MPAQTVPEALSMLFACRSCGKVIRLVSAAPSTESTIYNYQCANRHRHELVTAGGALSQLYLNLASECFNQAAKPDQADGAETWRRMGRHYVAQAAAFLDDGQILGSQLY
jgi:hypothetical protein